MEGIEEPTEEMARKKLLVLWVVFEYEEQFCGRLVGLNEGFRKSGWGMIYFIDLFD